MKFIKFSMKSDMGKKMLNLSFLLFFMFLGVHTVDAQEYANPQEASQIVEHALSELQAELGASAYKDAYRNPLSQDGLRIRLYSDLLNSLKKSTNTKTTVDEAIVRLNEFVSNAPADSQGPVSIQFEKSTLAEVEKELTGMVSR